MSLTSPNCAESHLSRSGLVIVYGYHYLEAKHRAAIAIADSVASRKKRTSPVLARRSLIRFAVRLPTRRDPQKDCH